MTDTLTDAQVAALAKYLQPDCADGPPECIECTAGLLATEVLQSRQRRCGNCRFFVPGTRATTTCDNPDKDLGPYFTCDADWSCADFTPTP